MESRAKLLGHPIHPMLVALPIGLLVTAVIFDVVRLATDLADFGVAAYWSIAGVVGGLAAAVVGFWDWMAIPSGTRGKRIGTWHGAGDAVALVLFAGSWWLRAGSAGYTPGVTAFLLSLVGAGTMAVTGWLGGELVHRLGVGQDPGANLDAPSSLSGRPADEAPDASAPGPWRSRAA